MHVTRNAIPIFVRLKGLFLFEKAYIHYCTSLETPSPKSVATIMPYPSHPFHQPPSSPPLKLQPTHHPRQLHSPQISKRKFLLPLPHLLHQLSQALFPPVTLSVLRVPNLPNALPLQGLANVCILSISIPLLENLFFSVFIVDRRNILLIDGVGFSDRLLVSVFAFLYF